MRTAVIAFNQVDVAVAVYVTHRQRPRIAHRTRQHRLAAKAALPVALVEMGGLPIAHRDGIEKAVAAQVGHHQRARWCRFGVCAQQTNRRLERSRAQAQIDAIATAHVTRYDVQLAVAVDIGHCKGLRIAHFGADGQQVAVKDGRPRACCNAVFECASRIE